jgi:hypothetical protein
VVPVLVGEVLAAMFDAKWSGAGRHSELVRAVRTVRHMPSGPVRRPPHELAFAAAIRAARIETGLTLHTGQSAEQGARRTSVGEAAAIAQVLGRSLDELVKVAAWAAKF